MLADKDNHNSAPPLFGFGFLSLLVVFTIDKNCLHFFSSLHQCFFVITISGCKKKIKWRNTKRMAITNLSFKIAVIEGLNHERILTSLITVIYFMP